ncbi:MAG: hypothetical protein WC866_03525 [Patescibacteria group bacterium]|jgi:hypothetical protein
MGLFDRKKPAAKEGEATPTETAPFVETKPDGTLADPEVLGLDAQPPVPGTALIPAPKPKVKRPRRPSVLKPKTDADCAANPIDENHASPKLKLFQTTGRPAERGYRLIDSILQEREGGIVKALWFSLRRMSHKRMGFTSVLSGVAGGASFALLGPFSFLAVPAFLIADRARETRRVRRGRHNDHDRVSESDTLRVSSAALAISSQDRASWPWELRCQWLLAAWRFQLLIRNYNMRAEVVNAALQDATMSPAEHAAALRMGELLRKEYPRLENIRRFLEDDLYGQNLKRPMSEMVEYDTVIPTADPFGYRDKRHAPIDWLMLPHHVFTRKQLLDQLRVDLDTIAGLRVGIREADKDSVDLEIERLERAERTGKRKKLPPPTDE